MIGFLKGTLIEKTPPQLIVDVSGVGYEVDVPMTTLYRLPAVGQPVSLHTHMVVREDAQLLYGFFDKTDREFFRELIRVNGVGPKMALAIMSGLEVSELVRCVQAQETTALVKIPGIGKKTAERLLVELKDRFKAWETMPSISGLVEATGAPPIVSNQVSDAVSALIALGFKAAEAKKAVDGIAEPDLTSEELIKKALKGMVR